MLLFLSSSSSKGGLSLQCAQSPRRSKGMLCALWQRLVPWPSRCERQCTPEASQPATPAPARFRLALLCQSYPVSEWLPGASLGHLEGAEAACLPSWLDQLWMETVRRGCVSDAAGRPDSASCSRDLGWLLPPGGYSQVQCRYSEASFTPVSIYIVFQAQGCYTPGNSNSSFLLPFGEIVSLLTSSSCTELILITRFFILQSSGIHEIVLVLQVLTPLWPGRGSLCRVTRDKRGQSIMNQWIEGGILVQLL